MTDKQRLEQAFALLQDALRIVMRGSVTPDINDAALAISEAKQSIGRVYRQLSAAEETTQIIYTHDTSETKS